jgi:bifunctional non-homologous end joining protein LigD
MLDGEIVTLDRSGRSSFSRLQRRMHISSAPVAERLAAEDPAVLMVFDVLHLDGHSLLELPWSDRRQVLESLELAGESWQTPVAMRGTAAEAYAESKKEELEGVVAKRRDSLYRPGRRSPEWIKLKNIRTQEVVVGGWRSGSGNRAGTIGALLLGLPSPEGLHYIGRVGTGFTQALLADLFERFGELGVSSSPFVDIPRVDAHDAHWVSPTLVGEVAFSEWTTDNRLRHPAWRGLRPDKSPDQVVRES